jgi:hypothetical protein
VLPPGPAQIALIMAAAPQTSTELAPAPGSGVLDAIARSGFAFVDGATMRELLAQAGSLADWQDFADSWDDLQLDSYMADGGRYRRRRHALYQAAADGAISRRPHGPHYQSLDYNPLNGGKARWFEPVTAVGDGPSMQTILMFCRATFGRLAPDARAWHIETHQFRIEARPGEAGQPTPEGLHRDGVDYVLVLLIRRRNIAQGTTAIHALDRSLLGSFTLTDPLDAAMVNDARVYHGVTAVEPVDSATPAFRDVLVVTFRKA